jgi:hypothetical protein
MRPVLGLIEIYIFNVGIQKIEAQSIEHSVTGLPKGLLIEDPMIRRRF